MPADPGEMKAGGGHSGGSHLALVLLASIWGSNWLVLKVALAASDPITVNVERTWIAIGTLFVALVWLRRPVRPVHWVAIVVTRLFQTTLNTGATAIALAQGEPGRTSMLVFTMPFWTILIARPILGERIRGLQWLAVAFAAGGLLLVVAPWHWSGALAPKLWAVVSGLGWAAGTVATKYFQRDRLLEPLNFMLWQMIAGVLPLMVLMWALPLPGTRWSLQQAAMMTYAGALSTALGAIVWLRVLRHLSAGTAGLSTFSVPIIALAGSMAIMGERPSPTEWIGFGAIAVGLVLVAMREWQLTRGAP